MTAKRMVIHFHDETGTPVVSQPVKYVPHVGDVALLNGSTYTIRWRRPSATSIDFGASRDRMSASELEPAADGNEGTVSHIGTTDT